MANEMTPEMQKAAVQAALQNGMKPHEVKKAYPELAEAVNRLEAEGKQPPRRRGSGPSRPLTTKPPAI